MNREIFIDMKTKVKNLTPQQALDSTKRVQFVDKEVLETWPKPIKGEIEFFKLNKWISDNDLEKEYESRGLIPASPYDLCTYDQDKLNEKQDVGTHWKDTNGNWCFAAFSRWSDERGVSVYRDDLDWGDYWWFGGVRKSALGSKALKTSGTLPLVLEINGVKYKRI